MLPGDRLICAFIEPLAVGDVFNSWPLHVTIVPWFRLPDTSEQLAKGLGQALVTIAPFVSKVGGEVMLGPKKDRPANLLEPSRLEYIEPKVRGYLHKKQAWLVDETTKIRRPFRPHVTFQGEQRLSKGVAVYCDRLYIVEQAGDHKRITAEIVLA